MSQRQATKEQQQIIEATEGNIRVRAVPGSGKTFALTKRIVYLILELYVEPSSIVAMTFTNKAANEMKYRLKKMIGDFATCYAGTFHGYCNLILKEEIYRLSYPKTFVILDKKAQVDLIREVADELGFSLKDFTAKEYADKICEEKQDRAYIPLMLDTGREALQKKISHTQDPFYQVYYSYLKKQRDNYVLDFEDIIQFAIYILTQYKEALKKWQSRCQYLLCDEYQDVNKNQEYLLYLLSGKYHTLTVVGDDDQCIYGWRGSDVEYMVHFNERYENVMDYSLSRNFRSTPEIVAAANSLIEKNQNRLEKQMYTQNPHGAKPVYNCLPYEKDEAVWIAEQIDAAVSTGKKYADHTVLVRAASQTRALEEAFLAKKIPYKILNGARFYDSEEIRTVLAYLRMVYAPNDLDFLWTIKRPRKGFGKKSIEDLKKYAAEHEIGLFQALGEQIEQGTVKKEVLAAYYKNISELHKEYDKYSCKELVNRVLDFGYREELEQDVEQRRLDNVTELITAIAAMEAENQDKLSLEELLAHFALFTAQDDDDEKNVVKVMTIHTAKGLEFDIVFICGLVDGQFPSRRLRNEDELEEERRLFYVAVTRAKTRLYLSSYAAKSEGFPVRPSAFIQDIDYNLLECVGNVVQNGQTTPQMLPKKTFDVGDKVEHKIFGVGTIVDINLSTQSYEIDFEKLTGTRKIMFRAELKKV